MLRDALVVGINSYQYLPALRSPARDAEAIAQRLQTAGEFRVHRLPEAIFEGKPQVGQRTPLTLRELESALVRLFKPPGNTVPQTALFYFSGHGVQKSAGIQEGYLALSDSCPEVGFYGLSLFWLRRLLQESPVRQRVILLDCCHSGELLNFLEADPGARSGTDRLFMAAAREYESAYESLESPYSVMTQALIQGLDPNGTEAGIVTNHSLTAWISTALKGELQQPLFENSGSEIVLTRCSGPRVLPRVEPSQDICPYRGLEFFDEDHAEYFFGREEFTDQLIEQLRSTNFVAVVGASGSGKSSLVRAGLISELRKGQKFSGSDRWRIKLLTPTEHPLKSLAAAFVNPQDSDLEKAEQLRRAEAFLEDGGVGLAQLVCASLMSELGATGLDSRHSRHMLLVIDQFEEVFTLCQGEQAEVERRRFFSCLIEAMKACGDRLSVVVVLRADFVGKCTFYNELAQQIEQQLMMVTPLTYEQIKATIVQPAQKVGLVCEPNLIYTMLLDVVGAPGELPLLQYTLLELWRRRQAAPNGGPARLTLDAYTELGGVRGTLQKRATELFHSLTAEEQIVAKRIFLALTQLGEGTEDTRRRILKPELVSASFTVHLVERVLEKLVTAKLVVTSRVTSVDYCPVVSSSEMAGALPFANHLDTLDAVHASVRTSTHGAVSAAALRLFQRGQGGGGQAGEVPRRLADVQIPLEGGAGDRLTAQRGAAKGSEGKTANAFFCQETVDVAHEALIRSWSLLRLWLDESREMLRRKRRIEQTAYEWGRTGCPSELEYLLQGNRLRDAEDFLSNYPEELSALAQRYVRVSQDAIRKVRKEGKLLQLAIPGLLFAALTVFLNQYLTVMRAQVEKDYQLRIATSRERAAIAQSLLQEPDRDPMTALLISRLAAQGGHTYEAQSSLRAAVQSLRLQLELRGHQGAVQHLAISSNGHSVATAGQDGKIQLWRLDPQMLYTSPAEPLKTLFWETGKAASAAVNPALEGDTSETMGIAALAFSSDGSQIVAIAHNDTQIKRWSVESGAELQPIRSAQPVTQLALSADGKRLASVSADQVISIWNFATGRLQAQIKQAGTVNHLQFSADGQSLLIARNSGTARVWQLTSPPVASGSGDALGSRQIQPELAATFSHPSAVHAATFSASGKWIATACEDGIARIWDAQTGILRQTFVPDRPADESASLGVPVLSPRPQAEEAIATPSPVTQVVFSSNEQFLATTTSARHVRLWDLKSNQLHAELGVLAQSLSDVDVARPDPLTFSPDGQVLLTVGSAQSERRSFYSAALWDVQRGQEIGFLPGHTGTIETAQFSSQGNFIVTASADGVVRVWSTQPGGEFPALATSSAPAQWVTFVQTAAEDNGAIAPSSSAIVPSASPLSVAPVASAQPEAQPRGWFGPVAIARSWLNRSRPLQWLRPAENASISAQIMTVSADGVLKSWIIPTASMAIASDDFGVSPATSARSLSLWQQLRLMIRSVALNRTDRGTTSLTAIASSPTQELEAAENRPLFPENQSTGGLTSVAFSPNGQLMATARAGGGIEIYQKSAQQVERLHSIARPQAAGENSVVSASSDAGIVRQLSFSPDGRSLLGIVDDQTVQVWDVLAGKPSQTLRGHDATIQSAQFSPDGQRIVTASWDRTARIWQVVSGEMVKTFPHEDGVASASFSPDGQKVVTASWDGMARILDSNTGGLRVVLTGHQQAVMDAQFSPDGRSLVTASQDGTARLWDAQTGLEQAALRPEVAAEGGMYRAFFSPDGQYIATMTSAGDVNLWAATWERLLDLARDRSLRQLTPEECIRHLRLSPDACPTLELGRS